MKSGLEGRNNQWRSQAIEVLGSAVSMKSGLEGRNNPGMRRTFYCAASRSLNEVRPRRPEQLMAGLERLEFHDEGLNEVRPRRPEQSDTRNRVPSHPCRLNEVRPRRPEQCIGQWAVVAREYKSQ